MAISNPPTGLTPELRYHWAEPPASKPLDIGPDWIHPALLASEELAANLAGYEWKTPFLRDSCRPGGNEDRDEARKLVQQFADAVFRPHHEYSAQFTTVERRRNKSLRFTC
jgi:hypothetical protein